MRASIDKLRADTFRITWIGDPAYLPTLGNCDETAKMLLQHNIPEYDICFHSLCGDHIKNKYRKLLQR